MIELRQLHQFVAVAEELSFRRAAERLHMAQPPLTVAIKRIEAELGTILIERTNRVTRLTEAGRAFLGGARRAIDHAEEAMRAAQRAGAGLTGTLRITFVASAAREVLPPILRRFRERHADVELQLIESMSARQVDALLADQADVGFVIPPVREAGRLRLDVLARNQLVAVLPEGHRLAGCNTVQLSDLADEPWVTASASQGPGLMERIQASCAQAGFAPRISQEAFQMDTIVSLVAGALGVALVARSLVTADRRGVVFRALSGPGTPVEYELAVAYGRPSPVLDAFSELVRAWADRRLV